MLPVLPMLPNLYVANVASVAIRSIISNFIIFLYFLFLQVNMIYPKYKKNLSKYGYNALFFEIKSFKAEYQIITYICNYLIQLIDVNTIDEGVAKFEKFSSFLSTF